VLPVTDAAVSAQGWPPGRDAVLELAVALAGCSSLSEAIELTLPALALAVGAPVTIFAAAGSRASGARCWPRDADWASAFEHELSALWENGPLTELCRRLGVVPPFRIAPLVRQLGWASLPMQAPVDGQPLQDAACLPVAVVGTSVCGYFVGRTDRDLSDEELERLARLQLAVVASHGRFLRSPAGSAVLTPRQQEILRLLRGGLTTGAIASRLRISESTVGKHLRDLYARLGTHDRVSTIQQAQAAGLLDGVTGESWQDVRFP